MTFFRKLSTGYALYQSYRKYARWALLITFPYGWYKLNYYDKNEVKRKSFMRGLELSQKFKKYPVWDKYVEMLMVRQFSILFIAGNSFIKGLVSDNENQKGVDKELDQMKKSIIDDLKDDRKDLIKKP